MSYKNIVAPFICMFFLACCMSRTLAASSAEVGPTVFVRLKFKVHILNGFEDNAKPLLVHCRSKNDDLGNQILWKGKEFQFEFRIHWFKTTHFTCNFDWASKKLDDITVFKNDQHAESYACVATGNCFWKAAMDGLYFSNNDQNWVKKFDWK
ncbi:Plant self-incompatibility S1 [Corchorus olitorius]|uniref:S-protein homolog n=1 Tax=Corchorus olitorius TaxID=93759 RepID=A0A1R3KQ16_9ROSI|nr:Plant self-incompatibility S1 [Corchorus olitorius]